MQVHPHLECGLEGAGQRTDFTADMLEELESDVAESCAFCDPIRAALRSYCCVPSCTYTVQQRLQCCRGREDATQYAVLSRT